MASNVIFNAPNNTIENKRRLLRDSNSKIEESLMMADKSSSINKSKEQTQAKLKVMPTIPSNNNNNSLVGEKAARSDNHNGNNIAKMLFGTKMRSQSIKKERNSIEKESFEKALNSSMKEGSKSEDKKPRIGPKITVINRNNTSNLKANTTLKDSNLNNSRTRTTTIKVGPKEDSTSKIESKETLQTNQRQVMVIQGSDRKEQGEEMLQTMKKMTRTRIVNRMDHLLNKDLVPIPKGNEFTDGPSIRDNRRGKLLENQGEAKRSWEEFFGTNNIEVRWDLFEDFLYLMSEFYLGKHLTLIKDTNWDEYFMSFFRILGKPSQSVQNFKEVPEVPFSTQDLIYKGKTVTKPDWISHVENNGIELTLKHMAEKVKINERLRDSVSNQSNPLF